MSRKQKIGVYTVTLEVWSSSYGNYVNSPQMVKSDEKVYVCEVRLNHKKLAHEAAGGDLRITHDSVYSGREVSRYEWEWDHKNSAATIRGDFPFGTMRQKVLDGLSETYQDFLAKRIVT